MYRVKEKARETLEDAENQQVPKAVSLDSISLGVGVDQKDVFSLERDIGANPEANIIDLQASGKVL